MATAHEHFTKMLDLNQEAFGASITYTSRTRGAKNTSTGLRANTDVSVVLTAIRGRDSTSPGIDPAVKIQEVVFAVQLSDLTAAGITQAQKGDVILDEDSITREVVDWERMIGLQAVAVRTRRELR